MAFPWGLSDSKSPGLISSILVELNNAVIFMVSTPIHRTNSLVTVPNAPVAIAITVIFMLHVFLVL